MMFKSRFRSRLRALSLLCVLGLFNACGPAPTSLEAYPSPAPYASAEPMAGSLASLLTGQVVDAQEQQLRDNLQRQIVLDFPIRVGVVYYQLNSPLDKVDQETVFDQAREALAETGLVKETLLIPQSFVSGAQSFEGLRTLGSRFQTDVLLIVTGQHNFSPSRQQDRGFFDSFSNTVAYESQVSLEAIALDVYTGTLLKPFEASAKGERILLSTEDANFHDQAYGYKKDVETQAWKSLQDQMIVGIEQLKKDVDEALKSPMPSPSVTPSP